MDQHTPVRAPAECEAVEFSPEVASHPSAVVVVGASAGGVEVLRDLVSGLPEDFPGVVCITLHLPARGVSHLPEILTRSALLPAYHPSTKERMRPGTIYIAPPDEHLVVLDGYVELSHAARENHSRPSIDVLFRSAAEAYGPRAIGIVLSGTREDGALGLRLLRTRGGTAIVQDPSDAPFPGMPESALSIAGADYVLPIRDIAGKVVELVERVVEGNVRAEATSFQDSAIDPAAPAEASTMNPSVFSCPACGGVLWEQTDGDVTSYRCRVGHAYAPESLLDAQQETAESSLRMAIRVLEEQADLAARLERRARQLSKNLVADRFARDRDEATRNAEVLQRLVDDVRLPVKVEPQGIA